ncbi:MAG TPA: discoidin domain-containing protein [Vicinamibacterales bacterium]
MRAHLPVLLAYAVITILLTWPLAISLDHVVPHDLGDPLMSAAILWWNTQELPFTAAWWNGPFFFPATDTLALSDHRVGLGLFATPLIWLGAAPTTAYNVTFLLTWWLSALAAYALAWTLTSSRAAAFVAGCVFGFNPFRAAHLSHLELLAAYCLPIVLLALHQWLTTRRRIWLVLLAAAWLLQALTGGYFFFFMMVFVALWLLWFVRAATLRDYASLGLALIGPLLIVLPVLLHYRRAHQSMGLARSVDEIKQFSADVVALVTAPEALLFWNTPSSWWRPEGELMPGLFAVIVAVAGLFAAPRRGADVPRPIAVAWLRRALLTLTLIAGAAAMLPAIAGPRAFTIAGVHVSISTQDKPLSLALLFGVLWIISSTPFIAAFRSQSVLAFYWIVMIVMWLLALGPVARLMGRKVLYMAPYSLLMMLPGFSNSFRAPARFGLLAVLALSVAAAVAIKRLTPRIPVAARAAMFIILAGAVLAESWIYPFPVVPVPVPLELPADVPASAAVLELPTGVFEDGIATFHTTQHHRRSINGLSGYEPPHYAILTRAIREGNVAAVNVLRRYADIAVYSDSAALTAQMRAIADTGRLSAPPTNVVVLHARSDQSPTPLASREVRLATINTDRSVALIPSLIDDDYDTAWQSGAPQGGGETLVIQLAEMTRISGVRLSSGRFITSFARGIGVEISADGVNWEKVAAVDGAMAALDAALRDQRHVHVTIPFEPRPAQHVRVTQTGQSSDAWAVAEVRVLAPRVE